jgi:hypothetical protein
MKKNKDEEVILNVYFQHEKQLKVLDPISIVKGTQIQYYGNI